MPLALDPEALVEFVLASDRGKDDPPTFIFCYLANREWKKVAHLADNLGDYADKGLDALIGEMESALALGLRDWRGMVDPATGEDIPYTPENIEQVVNPAEMSELIFGFLERVQVSVEDKKKPDSPSLSSSDSSVKTVTEKAADAPKDRQN